MINCSFVAGTLSVFNFQQFQRHARKETPQKKVPTSCRKRNTPQKNVLTSVMSEKKKTPHHHLCPPCDTSRLHGLGIRVHIGVRGVQIVHVGEQENTFRLQLHGGESLGRWERDDTLDFRVFLLDGLSLLVLFAISAILIEMLSFQNNY